MELPSNEPMGNAAMMMVSYLFSALVEEKVISREAAWTALTRAETTAETYPDSDRIVSVIAEVRRVFEK